MNVKRFVARTSRDALLKVRQAFGDDGVVLSTRPSAEGVEVLAMTAASVATLERMEAPAAEPAAATAAAPAPARAAAVAPGVEVDEDVERLAMSTLSFQDYVRERMLKRRQAALAGEPPPAEPSRAPEPPPSQHAQHLRRLQSIFAPARAAAPVPQAAEPAPVLQAAEPVPVPQAAEPVLPAAVPALPAAAAPTGQAPAAAAQPPAELPPAAPAVPPVPALAAQEVSEAISQAVERERHLMLGELREMRGMIEERFGALAFMERFQRSPALARLTQKLLDCGFSPALIRKLVQGAPAGAEDLLDWCGGVLERNLNTGEGAPGIEDLGGVWALIGSTGVGKTTSTAKIAAAFAAKYGAANLGLITLDAYRVGAHEQLRAYGRIIGCAVHTAHDRAALDDLLGLLAGKKLVLIDTAGMAQRDSRTKELLEMIGDPRIQRLLVLNAAAQGETIEDVLVSYRAAQCRGVLLSKLDEAVKLGPAVDAMIRYRLPVMGIANGQRVPEDWHRVSAHALVQRALRGGGSSAYRLDSEDVSLVFTAPGSGEVGAARGGAHV
ncbi:flagellar biosynthesis protein FlhF [Caldimonas tepidiphila]|uniref:flagellar biosynthesis protein FlhF n=1 Tax=Caldimonas tepidiphila TaxID=2315841 RepID=UPI000E5BAA0C|nr:flagellar biosynthesis protein FlhF [Caldimonas tepidiphila]